jgi:8-oxo-dGTP pyrophosphatase MutT (NUDIX family)
MDDHYEVEAAGGLVWREGEDHGVVLAVVHRPRYNDWSLPKGKLDPGESHETAALREVEEETGLEVELEQELSSHFYQDNKGRSKRVRWWAMQALEGEFIPNQEVDQLRWVTPDEALGMLTYTRDRELVSDWLAGTPPATSS